MKKAVFFLFLIGTAFYPVIRADLVEVGSVDLSFVDTDAAPRLVNSGIQPDFSVLNKSNGSQISNSLLNIIFSPTKQGKSVLLKHSVKPSVITGSWNPSNYAFCLDTNFGTNSGQYVSFALTEPVLLTDYNSESDLGYNHWETQEVWHQWNFGETQEIIFDENHVFLGSKLLFNSVARDFSQELQKFLPYKIGIKKNLVSMCFTTKQTSATDFLNFYDLITKTKAICNSGDANVTWFDGNTYYLNVDGNVNVENCQLTINPGAIVKFDTGGLSNLRVLNKGILKAQGTSTNKIIFTSSDDNSVGVAIGKSDGKPSKEDYNIAICLFNNAGVIPDSNNLNDLNIGYGRQAIVISKDINSIHDLNIHDTNSLTVGQNILIDANIIYFYNNTIKDNNSNSSGNDGIIVVQKSIVYFYNNSITNNSSKLQNLLILKDINNFYDNYISNNTTTFSPNPTITFCNAFSNCLINNFYNNTIKDNNGIGFSQVGAFPILNSFYNNFISNNFYGGVDLDLGITNFYNNIIQNNHRVLHGAGVLLGTGAAPNAVIINFYNNTIKHNVADGNGAGIFLNRGNITNFYNNIIQDNNAKGGAGVYVGLLSNMSNGFNNTFFNNFSRSFNNGGAIVINSSTSGASVTNFYNNIFAYNSGVAILKFNNFFDCNFNVFWANDVNYSGVACGSLDINLGATPFIDDGSDRNFLLNTYGITQLTGKANSNTGTNTFFTARTVRYDNRLDYNRTPGWHADQNSPYIAIFSPGIGTYTGNISIDFNVSSNAQNADVNIDLNLLKATALDQNGFYLKQAYASWICNAALPSTTRDMNCTYVLDSTGIVDANYLVQSKAIDKNGTGNYRQSNSFQVLNDAIAPNMNNDVNINWQNADANVRVWCDDTTTGNSDINSIAINKDNAGWLFFDKSGLAVKSIDHNAFFSTDGNHDLNYFCSDVLGNVADTNTTYVLIDKTPPTTTSSVLETCFTDDANIFLACTDALSGCNQTHYSLNLGVWQLYDSNIYLNPSGLVSYSLDFNSTDLAGNTDNAIQINFTIDGLPFSICPAPTIAITPDIRYYEQNDYRDFKDSSTKFVAKDNVFDKTDENQHYSSTDFRNKDILSTSGSVSPFAIDLTTIGIIILIISSIIIGTFIILKKKGIT